MLNYDGLYIPNLHFFGLSISLVPPSLATGNVLLNQFMLPLYGGFVRRGVVPGTEVGGLVGIVAVVGVLGVGVVVCSGLSQ